VIAFVPGAVVAGRFRLERLLGEGGMGTVWAATHQVTRKPIALKTLKAERATDPSLRRRFLREARAASVVRHPNIVEVHDVVELDDGSPMMVMELLAGESLGARLDRERALSVADLARVMLPVISAVGTAHAAGVVHRDLKPDNIFLAREPDGATTVKVLDFGIAKVLTAVDDGPHAGALTGTGAMLGTPYYMAPEQIYGERDIDHRADIWALGVIFYECLSGGRPTHAANVGQILKIITTNAIVPLERVVPSLPSDITELVRRMLSRDRDARPRTLSEVQAALSRYCDVSVRSFGAPAVPPPSLSQDDDGAVIRRDNSNPLSSTKIEAAAPNGARLGESDVSATAPTLASSTAATTADRALFETTPRKRRGRWVAVVAGGAAIAVAVFVGVARNSTNTRDLVQPDAAPAAATVAEPAASPSAAPSAAPAESAPSASASATSAPSSSAPASTPKPGGPRAASTQRPSASAAPSAIAPPVTTTTATTKTPGGIVDKPPF
jgi:serine/threonine-protein kinase